MWKGEGDSCNQQPKGGRGRTQGSWISNRWRSVTNQATQREHRMRIAMASPSPLPLERELNWTTTLGVGRSKQGGSTGRLTTKRLKRAARERSKSKSPCLSLSVSLRALVGSAAGNGQDKGSYRQEKGKIQNKRARWRGAREQPERWKTIELHEYHHCDQTDKKRMKANWFHPTEN